MNYRQFSSRIRREASKPKKKFSYEIRRNAQMRAHLLSAEGSVIKKKLFATFSDVQRNNISQRESDLGKLKQSD